MSEALVVLGFAAAIIVAICGANAFASFEENERPFGLIGWAAFSVATLAFMGAAYLSSGNAG